MNLHFISSSLMLLVCLTIISCTKESKFIKTNSSDFPTQYKEMSIDLAGVLLSPTHLTMENCADNEDDVCGSCPGVCTDMILLDWSLTEAEIESGYGYLSVQIQNNQLHASFSRSVDDGSGSVLIDKDFFIGTEASNLLGFQEVIILQGHYPLDYSNFEFGETNFTISSM